MNFGRNHRERSRSNSQERRPRSIYNDPNKNSYNGFQTNSFGAERNESFDGRHKMYENDKYHQNKKYSYKNQEIEGENNLENNNRTSFKNYNYPNYINDQNRGSKIMANPNKEPKSQLQPPLGNICNFEPKNIKINFIYQPTGNEQQKANSIPQKKIQICNSIRMNDPRFKIVLNENIQIEKLNLILDLDETLINAVPDPQCAYNFPASDLKQLSIQNQTTFILIRPHVAEFLEELSRYFNMYVYSHGEYPYVEKVLELIDKDKKYISREIIFKNMKQVTNKTPKSLKNLNLSAEEIQKSIVIDDQRVIWEDEWKKVIPSKKYVPFRDFMDQKKLKEFLLFKGESSSYVLSESKKDQDFYLDSGTNSTQLKNLKHLLKCIYEKYNIYKLRGQKNIPPSEEIYHQCLKQLLIDFDIEIMIESPDRKNLFEDLAKNLGARIIDIESEAKNYKPSGNTFLIVEKEPYLNNHFFKRQVQLKRKNNIQFKVISVYWLVECFFSYTVVSREPFEIEQ